MNQVCGYSWDQIAKKGIVTVQDGATTKAYRIESQADCDSQGLEAKRVAGDSMFDTELTDEELGIAPGEMVE